MRTATATDVRELIERYVDLVVDFYVAHINLERLSKEVMVAIPVALFI